MHTKLVLLRNDLRLEDNPALYHSLQETGQTIALYVQEEPAQHSAQDAWRAQSLTQLKTSLEQVGVPLLFMKKATNDLILHFIQEQNITDVYWNRRYSPTQKEKDTELKQKLVKQAISTHSYNGTLLFEPWEVNNKQGLPFKVFTPMCKHLMQMPMSSPLPAPSHPQKILSITSPLTCSLQELNLTDPSKHWQDDMLNNWEVGEKPAISKMLSYIEGRILDYKQGRDIPSISATSTLSPHLAVGEISTRHIWKEVMDFAFKEGLEHDENIRTFLSELVWRDFSYQQLYFYDDISTVPIHHKFNNFPWERDAVLQKKWQQGQTGVPIVDAGMRELWATGTMHNRVRMIVASYFTKNLLQPWQDGAAYFMHTLVDADIASNSANWQWVAGCGLDASPYFRIFNPVTQGEKFDKEGLYVKKWVKELEDLGAKYIHKPWEAPDFELKLANIELGKTYPKPLVDLKASRERALEAYQHIK